MPVQKPIVLLDPNQSIQQLAAACVRAMRDANLPESLIDWMRIEVHQIQHRNHDATLQILKKYCEIV